MGGLFGSIELATQSSVTSDTESFIKQAKELENEEERLKSNFPAAMKVMEPGDETSSTDNEGNGHENESSGVVVEIENVLNGRDDTLVHIPEKVHGVSENGIKEYCKKIVGGRAKSDLFVGENAQENI